LVKGGLGAFEQEENIFPELGVVGLGVGLGAGGVEVRLFEIHDDDLVTLVGEGDGVGGGGTGGGAGAGGGVRGRYLIHYLGLLGAFEQDVSQVQVPVDESEAVVGDGE